MQLPEYVKSLVIVFEMPGCPHCEDYSPRFVKMVDEWITHGQPFYWYQPGVVIPQGVVPVLVLDAASEDPSIVTLADQYKIEGLPTTLLLTRRSKPQKIEGSIEDRKLYDLLSNAVRANR